MEIHRHAEGRWSCDDGGRGWRDAATSQGHQRLLATSRSWEQARKDPPLEVHREWALQTPMSDFRLSNLWLKPSSLWHFVTEPWETNAESSN